MTSNALSYDDAPRSSGLLDSTRDAASNNIFGPRGTVRCRGTAAFRTRAARDAACLFDMDRTISGWICLPTIISRDGRRHIPDFAIERSSAVTLVDVVPATGKPPPVWAAGAAKMSGHQYETMNEATFAEGYRLDNAREILRYATYAVSLGDRVGFLSFLDEHGPAPLATCASAFRNARDPVGAIASLALQRFIEIEIDEALIGPDTMVSRFRA